MQCEIASRKSKADLTAVLAQVLDDVAPQALNVPDIDSNFGLMHTFFAIEDIYGIKPSLQDDVVALQFENTKMLNPDLLQMIYSWAEQAKKYNSGEISKEEYDIWRYNYPAFANLKGYTKVPSEALSDIMIDIHKHNGLNSK